MDLKVNVCNFKCAIILKQKNFFMHFRTFLNGVVVGVILGVLFAPDSGEETRRKISQRAAGIKDRYDDIMDDVSYTYHKVKNRANEFVNKAKDEYSDLQDDAGSTL
jgi:gas vesicle protein